MEIIHRKANIQKAFSSIGKSGDTAPLDHSDNRFQDAYEFLVASELRSAANKRYERAKAKANELGIIDEEKCIVGSEIATYKSKFFDVTMKQATGSTTLDRTMLKNTLSRRGMKEKDIEQIIADSSKPKKGAVTVGFTLKG